MGSGDVCGQSEIKVLVAESMSHMYELSCLCSCAALHVYTSGRGLFERPLLVEDPVHLHYTRVLQLPYRDLTDCSRTERGH